MTYTGRMSFGCGRLVCNSIVSSIKNYCFKRGIEYNFDIDKGWIDCEVRLTIKSEKNKVEQAYKDIRYFAEHWDE